ncbi:MAG: DNA-binding protein HU [Candidatus Rokuibacteriota bacterium]|nr:MAG: DNA-binding protein HU [Candidatus Rokubacteria bacterium]PYN56532.1 MAG: DNA-binding protein HU [Candidatus Rokubacteria bacterium]
MIKADLVTIMAKTAGGSKTSAERAVNAMVTGIIDSLRRGRRVTISGFGTFVVARRAARNGRDPRTGKEITIPSAKVPRFRPSRSLKVAIR